MLSWRDVQHIIVHSTRHYPVKGVPESHWTENKAGFKGELKEEDGKSCTYVHAVIRLVVISIKYSCVRQKLSHKIVKVYATMPIGIMGSSSLALLDWGST